MDELGIPHKGLVIREVQRRLKKANTFHPGGGRAKQVVQQSTSAALGAGERKSCLDVGIPKTLIINRDFVCNVRKFLSDLAKGAVEEGEPQLEEELAVETSASLPVSRQVSS